MIETLEGYTPDPDNPGWHIRDHEGDTFVDMFGVIRVKADTDTVARIWLLPTQAHRNILDTAHGGYLLAVVDQCLFVGPFVLGITTAARGLTIDTSAQFLSPVAIGRPLDVLVEVLRETGRMVFLRGTFEQDGVTALAFTGTIRKSRQANA